MDINYYSDERAVQIVISVLKANGIRNVIASPGTTNLTFVGSLQHDPWFRIFSSVDERSAAYMACGMAAESGEPVVLSCTGATASRNYFSGLTEAFYRKLPVLAITSHQGNDRLYQLLPQNIDRRQHPDDVVRLSVEIPFVSNEREEWQAICNANAAILELTRNGGGPVHINLFTHYSKVFNVKTLPDTRVINRLTLEDELPDIPDVTIGIAIGSHRQFTEKEVDIIERFCSKYDSVVFCDHTSGYYGPHRVQMSLVFCQLDYKSDNQSIELMIHIGEVSGAEGCFPKCKNIWRVSEDGEIRDTFKKLTTVFQMSDYAFFCHYASDSNFDGKHAFLDKCKNEYNKVFSSISELPFSNLWVAKELSSHLPSPSVLHLGILNSLRSWNFFTIPKGIESFCNVGGFGIDGILSSIIGASLINPQKLYYLVIGDLAFFYDLNALGNRHLGKNLRILLINNGCGTEFKNFNHPCYAFGSEADYYMAAKGHFGNKSHVLVKHYAEDLGIKYISAQTKKEFFMAIEEFVSPIIDSSMILEVFTTDEDESEALKIIRHSLIDSVYQLKKKATTTFRGIVGDNVADFIQSKIR